MYDRFGVSVKDERNNASKTYPHDGQQFICGKKGEAYTLVLRNNTPGRVLAVATVDGMSIMDGKPGSTKGEHGYVLSPYQTLEIPGWRLDNDDVARFRFGGPEKSYAAKMGLTTENLGVIGCAFYEEKVTSPTVVQQPYPFTPTTAPFGETLSRGRKGIGGSSCGPSGPIGSPGESGPASEGTVRSQSTETSFDEQEEKTCGGINLPQNSAQQGLGTQFGEKLKHQVQTVSFIRKDDPSQVFVLRYNDAENLAKMGIVLEGYVPAGSPNPFPADPKPAMAGCAAPEDWKG
jgi:hypothetical protein